MRRGVVRSFGGPAAVAVASSWRAGNGGSVGRRRIAVSADPLLEPRPRPRSHFPAAFGPARCFCPACPSPRPRPRPRPFLLCILIAVVCLVKPVPRSRHTSRSLALHPAFSNKVTEAPPRSRSLSSAPSALTSPSRFHLSPLLSPLLLLLRLFDSASGSAASLLRSAQVWLAFVGLPFLATFLLQRRLDSTRTCSDHRLPSYQRNKHDLRVHPCSSTQLTGTTPPSLHTIASPISSLLSDPAIRLSSIGASSSQTERTFALGSHHALSLTHCRLRSKP